MDHTLPWRVFRVSTFPTEILQDVKLSTCSELIIFWNGVFGNDWILSYDQDSNFSILKRWTNLFRPDRTSKPLMNLSQDCWCCHVYKCSYCSGGTMPTTSYSKTTNGLYAWLTTSEQLVDLGYPLSPIPRGKPQALKKALAVAQHRERISRSSEPGISPWFLVAMANSARCPTGIWS